MKKIICSIVVLFSLLGKSYGTDEIIINVEAHEWFSQGNDSMKVSFSDYWGDSATSDHRFDNLDIMVNSIEMGANLSSNISLEGSFGFGYINKKETIQETDMMGKRTDEVGVSGGTVSVEFNTYYKILSWNKSYIKGFGGYQYYYKELNMESGRFKTSGFPDWYPSYPDSFMGYEFIQHTVPLGVKARISLDKKIKPYLHDLSLVGSMSTGYSFLSGEDILISTKEKFRANGYTLSGDIGIKYQPIKTISIEAGYKFYSFKSESGQGVIQDYWGMKSDADYEIKSFFKGPYVSLSGNF